MKVKLLAGLILAAVLLAACESGTISGPTRMGYEQWDKPYLVVNNIDIFRVESSQENHAPYPQISGLLDKSAENKINAVIREHGERLASGSGYWTEWANYNNVLYLRLIDFKDGRPQSADFLFDLTTGNRLGLGDLFRQDVDYIDLISTILKEEMIRQNLDGETLYRPFNRIEENQPFQLTDTALLISFPENNPYFSNPWIDPFSMEPASFSIPLTRLHGSVDIYSKYMTTRQIYENPERKKHLLPGPVNLNPHWQEKGGPGYEMVATYPELSNIPDKNLQDRLNLEFKEKAAEILDDTAFIREAIEKHQENNSWYAMLSLHIDVTNIHFLLSVSEYYHRSHYWERGTHTRHKTYLYHIETGMRLTLKDLFLPDTDYLSLLNRHIKKNPAYQAVAPQLWEPFTGISADTRFTLDLDGLSVYPFAEEKFQMERVHISYHELEENLVFFMEN